MKRTIQWLIKQPRKPKQWQLVSMIAVVLISLTVLSIYKTKFLAGYWGIRNDEIAVITIEEGDQEASLPETITVVAPNKSIWDLLELVGVPLVLAVLGLWFQQAQQAQSERLSKKQREQDADETREEVLQLYFDRISSLLIDKNLMAIAARMVHEEYALSEEEKELLDVSIDVIQARTLSILRRFDQDTERRSSAIRFLVEADVICRLKIDLSGTNLSEFNLSRVNLSGANLRGADLSGANLRLTDLSRADLSGADLSRADLTGAKLSGANLTMAKLIRANLIVADLSGADLKAVNLSEAKLKAAQLSGARLSEADLSEASVSNARFGKGIGLLESVKEDLKERGAIFDEGIQPL